MAEGMVAPARHSALGLPVGGTLREVLVDDGQGLGIAATLAGVRRMPVAALVPRAELEAETAGCTGDEYRRHSCCSVN